MDEQEVHQEWCLMVSNIWVDFKSVKYSTMPKMKQEQRRRKIKCAFFFYYISSHLSWKNVSVKLHDIQCFEILKK